MGHYLILKCKNTNEGKLSIAANKVMLGVSGEGMQDQEMFNLRSTCHIALDRCEKDGACR